VSISLLMIMTSAPPSATPAGAISFSVGARLQPPDATRKQRRFGGTTERCALSAGPIWSEIADMSWCR
jgi:hypothetical protein